MVTPRHSLPQSPLSLSHSLTHFLAHSPPCSRTYSRTYTPPSTRGILHGALIHPRTHCLTRTASRCLSLLKSSLATRAPCARLRSPAHVRMKFCTEILTFSPTHARTHTLTQQHVTPVSLACFIESSTRPPNYTCTHLMCTSTTHTPCHSHSPVYLLLSSLAHAVTLVVSLS